MGSRRRIPMYLSPEDDQQLINELERCTQKGRKSELLRNYALVGLQRALELYEAAESPQDDTTLLNALAELFAPQDSLPDFRSAADFIKAVGATRSGTSALVPASRPPQQATGPAPAEPQPVASSVDAVEPLATDAAVQAEERKNAVPGKPNWGNLKSLVAGNAKPGG